MELTDIRLYDLLWGYGCPRCLTVLHLFIHVCVVIVVVEWLNRLVIAALRQLLKHTRCSRLRLLQHLVDIHAFLIDAHHLRVVPTFLWGRAWLWWALSVSWGDQRVTFMIVQLLQVGGTLWRDMLVAERGLHLWLMLISSWGEHSLIKSRLSHIY